MKTIQNNDLTIGEIVANDFRAASIFKDAGIDFCCGGKKGLTEACNEKGVDPESVAIRLEALKEQQDNGTNNFKEWNIDFLCDYIVNTHHRFVLKNLPELLFYTRKIASVHGENHPELIEIAILFSNINDELSQHLKNEEEVLFPAIKSALANHSSQAKSTIISEISRMTGEHEFAGGAMDTINELSHHYLLPEDACNTFAITYKLLQQFEDDLHIHVHLENNILYPKALALTN
jgi:regulator of cell morphogenesis and NO signaling